MEAAQRFATYEDLLALPDAVRAEVMGGEVVVNPAPLPRHSRVQRALSHFVGGPFDDDDGHGGPGGWWILLEVDVHFATHDIVRPDLAGWRRERLSDPWEMRPITVVPDWICEVISPSHAGWDRVYKRQLYLRHGVDFYWIVDPGERTLEALQREGERWMEVGSYDDSELVVVPPFQTIPLDLARVFPPKPA